MIGDKRDGPGVVSEAVSSHHPTETGARMTEVTRSASGGNS
jgi:hypothetical protein